MRVNLKSVPEAAVFITTYCGVDNIYGRSESVINIVYYNTTSAMGIEMEDSVEKRKDDELSTLGA